MKKPTKKPDRRRRHDIPTTADGWREFAIRATAKLVKREAREAAKLAEERAAIEQRIIDVERRANALGFSWGRDGIPRWLHNGRPVIGSRRVGGWSMIRGGGWH